MNPIYDKVDAIRFEVFLQAMKMVADSVNPEDILGIAEDLMQDALNKMEGLEIIQRTTLPTESPVEAAIALLRANAEGPECPCCNGDGVLY